MKQDNVPMPLPEKKVSERLTLRKGEKLRHRTLVDALFSEGKNIYEYPIRMTWRLLDETSLKSEFRDRPPARIDRVQMLVTVPKKKRRKAVDRVLLRRRIREAYRLNRLELKRTVNQIPEIGTLSLAFIYLHNQNEDYHLIERKMKCVIDKLVDKLKVKYLKKSEADTTAED